MIPPHLSSQIASNVRETQRQAVLSASFPLPATTREAAPYPFTDTDGRRAFRQNLNQSTNFNESAKDAERLARAIAEHQKAMTTDDTSVFAWENIKTKSLALDVALAAHDALTTKGNEA